MDIFNEYLRELVPSGGWLGEVVIVVSDLLGVWDIFVLSVIFILSWVLIRTSWMETSICFGLVFDLGIPLQYVCDESSATLHKIHLEKYWTAFVIGCIIEAIMYFVSHPDLFTLVVSLKTSLCLYLWLKRGPSGEPITLGLIGASNTTATPTAAQAPTVRTASSTEPSSGVLPHIFTDDRYPDLDAQLKARGYNDPEGRQGMVLYSADTDDAEAKRNGTTWLGEEGQPLGPSDIARRLNKYKDLYRNVIAQMAAEARLRPAHLEETLRTKHNKLLNDANVDKATRGRVARGLFKAKTEQDIVDTLTQNGLSQSLVQESYAMLGVNSGRRRSGKTKRRPSTPKPDTPPPDKPQSDPMDLLRTDPLGIEIEGIIGDAGLKWPQGMRLSALRYLPSFSPDDANRILETWRAVLNMPTDSTEASVARNKASRAQLDAFNDFVFELGEYQ